MENISPESMQTAFLADETPLTHEHLNLKSVASKVPPFLAYSSLFSYENVESFSQFYNTPTGNGSRRVNPFPQIENIEIV